MGRPGSPASHWGAALRQSSGGKPDMFYVSGMATRGGDIPASILLVARRNIGWKGMGKSVYPRTCTRIITQSLKQRQSLMARNEFNMENSRHATENAGRSAEHKCTGTFVLWRHGKTGQSTMIGHCNPPIYTPSSNSQ